MIFDDQNPPREPYTWGGGFPAYLAVVILAAVALVFTG